MNHTDENPRQNVIAVIPARFSATRLPGKLLLPLAGKPLILHTLARAQSAKNVARVIVATDDQRILQTVQEHGGEAVLTAPHHQSGSDRIAEVARDLPENSIIVNVQGDEPTISPRTIEKAVDAMLLTEDADIITTCEPLLAVKDILNPNVVKVVTDKKGFALYFSRAVIPHPRDAVIRYQTEELALIYGLEKLSAYRKHTGLYVYRREYLLKYTLLPQSNLEKLESLEQLRALENGARIRVIETDEPSIGVDTPADFERVRKILEQI